METLTSRDAGSAFCSQHHNGLNEVLSSSSSILLAGTFASYKMTTTNLIQPFVSWTTWGAFSAAIGWVRGVVRMKCQFDVGVLDVQACFRRLKTEHYVV